MYFKNTFLNGKLYYLILLLFLTIQGVTQNIEFEYVIQKASIDHVTALARKDSIDAVFRRSDPAGFSSDDIVYLLQNRYNRNESIWVEPFAQQLKYRCTEMSIEKASPYLLEIFDFYLQIHDAEKARELINAAIGRCDTTYNCNWLGEFYLYKSYLYNTTKYDSAIFCLKKSVHYATIAGDSCVVAQSIFRQGHLALNMGQYPLAEELMKNSIPGLEGCDGYRYNVYYNAKYLLGLTLFVQGKYIDAIVSFDEVLNNHYDKLSIPDMWNIYELLGNIYIKQGMYDEAEKMHRNTLFLRHSRLQIVNKPDSTDLGIAYSYNNLAEVLLKKKFPDSAMAYAKESLAIKLHQNTRASKADIASSALNVGAVFLDLKNADSAMFYTEMASTLYATSIRKKEVLNCELQQGQINLLTGDYQMALNNADSVLALARETNKVASIGEAYHLKSLAYEGLQDYKQAYRMQLEYFVIHDTLIRTENVYQISNMLATHDAIANKKLIVYQKQLIKQTKDYNNLLLISISVILFLAILIIIYVLYNKQRQYVEMNREKQIIVLEKAVLEKEIEHNNRDLICSAKTILDRENVIKTMLKSINEIPLNEDVSKLGLKKSIKLIEKKIDGGSWKEFETRFKTAYPEFNHQLQSLYPDLSPTEWKLCTFLKLNLTTKQIAEMMHIAPSSVDVSRSRLRKKFKLSRDENLVEFIASL